MDFERFEEFVLQMAARHEQRMAQVDERLAETTQIQAGIAIGHAKLQADLAAYASRFDKQLAESAAEFDRRTAEFDGRLAGHDTEMESLRKEVRMVVKAVHDQTITLNRLMDRQTNHEQDPDAHRNLPRPA